MKTLMRFFMDMIFSEFTSICCSVTLVKYLYMKIHDETYYVSSQYGECSSENQRELQGQHNDDHCLVFAVDEMTLCVQSCLNSNAIGGTLECLSREFL